MRDDAPPLSSPGLSLSALGWDDRWGRQFAGHARSGLQPARVVCELRRHYYAVLTPDGESLGECTGRFHHQAKAHGDYPAVGDWVAVRAMTGSARMEIHALLPRRSAFERRAAGAREVRQTIAANIDTVFLVTGLDRNHNPKRLQRFIVAAHDSGAAPVIILNKTDLCADFASQKEIIEKLLPGVPVILTSASTRRGLKTLQTFCLPGRTLAFVGSSGAGKSSLINRLVRDAFLPVGEVREKDSKGRHTTTRRELIVSPSGALIIDTPGLRELQLWEADEGLEEAFADLIALACRCKFSNCRHENEPGCAVRSAIELGQLPAGRLQQYRKLKAEREAARPRQQRPSATADKPGWRQRAAERDTERTRRFDHD